MSLQSVNHMCVFRLRVRPVLTVRASCGFRHFKKLLIRTELTLDTTHNQKHACCTRRSEHPEVSLEWGSLTRFKMSFLCFLV